MSAINTTAPDRPNWLERVAETAPIVDAPASGHGLAMLTTPRTYAEVARVGPIRRRARMIQDFVSDPSQTGYVSVALAQEMPVTETIEFVEKLRDELGMTPDAVVVNALLPERFSTEEAAQIERAAAMNGSSRLSPVLHAALAEHRRARSQRAHSSTVSRFSANGMPRSRHSSSTTCRLTPLRTASRGGERTAPPRTTRKLAATVSVTKPSASSRR